jgi:Domain of unknown function (DUF4440)
MNRSKFILLLALLTAMVFAMSGRVVEAAAPRDTIVQIEKFEDDFSAALARNDVVSLQQLLSEDWKIISGDGSTITKTRFFSVLSSGELKHDTMTFDARTIRIYDNVALVTEHARSGGSYKGAAFHTDEVSTDVIVNNKGRWICVFTQLTTIVPKLVSKQGEGAASQTQMANPNACISGRSKGNGSVASLGLQPCLALQQ